MVCSKRARGAKLSDAAFGASFSQQNGRSVEIFYGHNQSGHLADNLCSVRGLKVSRGSNSNETEERLVKSSPPAFCTAFNGIGTCPTSKSASCRHSLRDLCNGPAVVLQQLQDACITDQMCRTDGYEDIIVGRGRLLDDFEPIPVALVQQ